MSKFEKAELVLKLLIAIGVGVLIWEWFQIIDAIMNPLSTQP